MQQSVMTVRGHGKAQRTMCMTSSSKEVERELPMWSSRSCGKVSIRYFFFLSEPQVVNTCRHTMTHQLP